MAFIIVNGEVIAKNDANLTPFLWDEPYLVSQKVWFGFGGIPLLNENLKVIKAQFDSLKIALPPLFNNQRELFRLTKRMLNKNKFYRSGFINYQFFISKGKCNSLITSETFSEFDFPYSEKGLLTNISNVTKNSTHRMGCFKCYNHILWQSANAQLINSAHSGSILLNERGIICEGIASNIFMLKDDVLATPSLHTGCYEDVLRGVILQMAKTIKLKIIESAEIAAEHLSGFDEIFFTSEEHGFQWVLGYNKRRFVHEVSERLYFELNNWLKEKVGD